MWTNYHTHSLYCDGKASITEVVDSAMRQGLSVLGFSSHAPLPFERKWCMHSARLNNYLEEIRLAKKNSAIELYAGLEADFIPGRASPFQFRRHLDYVIGSIHFVDEMPDGKGWEIDGSYQDFLGGLDSIFKGNMKSAVARYFELTRQMISESHPDIIGHLDKIKMQNKERSTFKEDDPWYVNEIQNTLEAARNAGCIIEVNTRGLYQRKTSATYPSPWILREISRRNIPVTLSSDAHHPDDLVSGFPDAAIALMRAGIKKIRILTDGEWIDVGFDEHGIKDYKVAR